jgi:hypothetical protein
MARSRSKHRRKRTKIRQAWKKRRYNRKNAAKAVAGAKTPAAKP